MTLGSRAGDPHGQEIDDHGEGSRNVLGWAGGRARLADEMGPRLVELKARVMGEIRDREISITNVQIDPETAEKMAAIFLARRRAASAQRVVSPLRQTRCSRGTTSSRLTTIAKHCAGSAST